MYQSFDSKFTLTKRARWQHERIWAPHCVGNIQHISVYLNQTIHNSHGLKLIELNTNRAEHWR